MDYLSNRGILHGDLAARNVLLCRNRIVKICDFGLSRKIQIDEDYQKESSVIGWDLFHNLYYSFEFPLKGPLPIKWLALESIKRKTFNTSTDVWSFGVFMWELFSLSSVPYPGIATVDLLRLLEEGFRLERPMYATKEIFKIMKSCWRESPLRRPTFTQLSHLLAQHISPDIKQVRTYKI